MPQNNIIFDKFSYYLHIIYMFLHLHGAQWQHESNQSTVSEKHCQQTMLRCVLCQYALNVDFHMPFKPNEYYLGQPLGDATYSIPGQAVPHHISAGV